MVTQGPRSIRKIARAIRLDCTENRRENTLAWSTGRFGPTGRATKLELLTFSIGPANRATKWRKTFTRPTGGIKKLNLLAFTSPGQPGDQMRKFAYAPDRADLLIRRNLSITVARPS